MKRLVNLSSVGSKNANHSNRFMKRPCPFDSHVRDWAPGVPELSLQTVAVVPSESMPRDQRQQRTALEEQRLNISATPGVTPHSADECDLADALPGGDTESDAHGQGRAGEAAPQRAAAPERPEVGRPPLDIAAPLADHEDRRVRVERHDR
ncbi:unnamed protein product [Prorocentrum cordatum]|uniref:Uncharacterized protein n=1 Tax=Prorocentrum cordatum TaxID=2364126 RepID=A0ABN9WQG9_9DINO|nr:unnamed protein product [Polarella glacialis]